MGSNTPIGSSIIRLLTSINADNIIAVSPSGTLPDGVDPKRVTTKFGDVIDIYTLNELFDEGDIIYNCQIIDDETASKSEAELYNNIGFINLLGIASLSGVNRIVCALPQALGYDLPEYATEHDIGKNPSPIQKTLRKSYTIAENYIEGNTFGWNQSRIAKFAKQAEIEAKNSEEKDAESDQAGGPSIKSTSSGPNMPKLSQKQKNHGPSLKTKQQSEASNNGPIAQSSGPTLGPKTDESKHGPSLGPSKSDDDQKEDDSESENVATELEDDENKTSEVEKIKVDDMNSNESVQNEGIDGEIDLPRVPLIIGRVAKLFGPFEPNLTPKYCKSIRLQRITVIGENVAEISWINPLDAGRAMILMGDPKLDLNSGHYPVNGFIASPREILETLDDINHSEVEISTRSLMKERIKHWFKSFISTIGFNVTDNFYYYLSHNRRQVFNDNKSRITFDWEPKYDLKKTAKDAMNWFISHQI